MKIISKKDLFTAITFFVFGLTFLTLSFKYELGTASEMGPAFFPVVTSILLLIVSVIMLVKSVRLK